MLKYRYPNLFGSTQLSLAKALLSKQLESYSYTVAEEKLCMSRLITYASDEGKSFPMLIGADYSDEMRSQMAMFLVSIQLSYVHLLLLIDILLLFSVAQAFTGLQLVALHTAAGRVL